ncbi:MAG: hypothetical protein ACTHW1_00745 [Ancrocorticia sp.]|uniref:hypothetical protein n=1 Tax=Ancrocorticia sp. TaxID=2593684 RepID=UPI003F93F686
MDTSERQFAAVAISAAISIATLAVAGFLGLLLSLAAGIGTNDVGGLVVGGLTAIAISTLGGVGCGAALRKLQLPEFRWLWAGIAIAATLILGFLALSRVIEDPSYLPFFIFLLLVPAVLMTFGFWLAVKRSHADVNPEVGPSQPHPQ